MKIKLLVAFFGSIYLSILSFLFAIIQSFIPWLQISETQFFILISIGTVLIGIGYLEIFLIDRKIFTLIIFIFSLIVSVLLIQYYVLLIISTSHYMFIREYFIYWAISHYFFILLFILISINLFYPIFLEPFSSIQTERTRYYYLKIISGFVILCLAIINLSFYSVYYKSQLKDITLNYATEILSFYNDSWKFQYSTEEIFYMILVFIQLFKNLNYSNMIDWQLSFWAIGVIGILIGLILYFEYYRD
ncbi:MAG: hypothetical protein ACTSO9_16515 [Candidatus Helarchaeota archaeon]